MYVVELAGVDDRHKAEALRGCLLLVPESDRPELGEDEYHVLDLIGLEVFNQLTQEVLGTVVDVFAAGNDLLQVKLHQQDEGEQGSRGAEEQRRNPESKIQTPKLDKTVLIPFVKAIVPVVELEAGRIEIAPPPGLLEIS